MAPSDSPTLGIQTGQGTVAFNLPARPSRSLVFLVEPDTPPTWGEARKPSSMVKKCHSLLAPVGFFKLLYALV